MFSQSDHYRRLFNGTLGRDDILSLTLGVLPIVFPIRALGGTLVHFLRDLPYYNLSSIFLELLPKVFDGVSDQFSTIIIGLNNL